MQRGIPAVEGVKLCKFLGDVLFQILPSRGGRLGDEGDVGRALGLAALALQRRLHLGGIGEQRADSCTLAQAWAPTHAASTFSTHAAP
jgi:hypothetical protein